MAATTTTHGGGGGGSIKSTSINGVKLYSLSGHRYSATPWLDSQKRRSLRKDQDYLKRVDLIQELRMETATTRIKATPDGEYVIASGIYPPQFKCYELKELSMKFERHLISEIINFQVLAEDYSKLAFLCADRSISLHAKYGSHYSLRIPRMGRDIAYDCWSCDLLCAASSPDLYRINLEKGRFLEPVTSQSPAINVVSRSMIHGLVACGGEDGAVECFDMRRKSAVGRISTAVSHDDINQEVTALQFDENQGYFMAVGSSTGKMSIYDLRMSKPLRVKDHMYGSPILSIKWHQTLNSSEPKLISADKHVVRIWDPNTGENMTSIEPNAGAINDVCIFQNSGLMLLALDNSQIPAYFIPALGNAPKWCSYLENLTEEMEEKSETVIYDDYKFLTKEEMERLNMTKYIGTSVVRAHLHGYLIDYRLYKKERDLANPFAYEEYIEKLKQEKIEARMKSRITKIRKIPKVNRKLVDRLLDQEETEDVENEKVEASNSKKKKRKQVASEILHDERFKQMFEDEDFEVDEQSQEYLALHPEPAKKQSSLIKEHLDPISDDDELLGASASDASTESESDRGEMKNPKRIRMYEVKDERHAEAFINNASLGHNDALPLGDRVSAVEKQHSSGTSSEIKFGPGGSREITYSTQRFRKYKNDQHKDIKRRGVQSLGLKPGKSEFYAMGGTRGKAKGARGNSRGRGRGRGRR